jgi:glucose-1-phosphate adenylyltransferase
MPGVEVGRGAVIKRAILDKNVYVHPGAKVGVDLELDKERYTVSHDGVVVIGKGDVVEP